MASNRGWYHGGSSGSSRSRSEGSRHDGDWICPQCRYVNYSSRMVCYRGGCGAARPSASYNPGIGPAPVPGAFDLPVPGYYHGFAGASPMPPEIDSDYWFPLPLPVMPYNYGPPSGASDPYSLLLPYGPSRPMGGVHVAVCGYEYRGPISGPTSGELIDNSALHRHHGGPDGPHWVYPQCGNVNSAFRSSCNTRECRTSRPTPVPNAHEGDWTCNRCYFHNYPFRNVCFRCGTQKPSSSR